MSFQNTSGMISLQPDSNMEAFVRVKLNGVYGSCTLAGADDEWCGVTQEAQTLADGKPILVRLRNTPGTFLMRADGIIAINAPVYGEAATGRISASVVGAKNGFRSMEAAAVAGDVIECAPSRV